jgi:hypothetical protein
LGDETAELLPQLPSLTKINEYVSFDWLRGLPNLIDVYISFTEAGGAADRTDSLVAALQCCTNIEILTFDDLYHVITAAHLTDLLPRLLRLRDLTLIGVDVDVGSQLPFLSQPPLRNQLSVHEH